MERTNETKDNNLLHQRNHWYVNFRPNEQWTNYYVEIGFQV